MTTQIVGGARMLHPSHPLAQLECPLCPVALVAEPITILVTSDGTGTHRKPPLSPAVGIPVHVSCVEAEL